MSDKEGLSWKIEMASRGKVDRIWKSHVVVVMVSEVKNDGSQ